MDTNILNNVITIVTAFATLAGVSALIAALVALARGMKWITSDEQVGKITAGLNLAAFLILVSLGVFRPDLSLDFLDSVFAQVATIALFVLGFITQMIVPAPVFRAFYSARVPGLGLVGEERAFMERTYAPNYSIGEQTPPKG